MPIKFCQLIKIWIHKKHTCNETIDQIKLRLRLINVIVAITFRIVLF